MLNMAKTTSLPQDDSYFQAMTVRDDSMFVLQNSITTCLEQGGGVVALVGAPGFGKSVLAKQFAAKNNEAVYLDGLTQDGKRKSAPKLTGIPLLDEVWQFDGVAQAINAHVNEMQGAVVAIACNESEAQALCGDLLRVVVQLPHWSGHQAAQAKNDEHQFQCIEPSQPNPSLELKRIGIVRFRGPNGEGWTGFGRTPKWLVTLEAIGHSREQYRVDSSPLTRRRRGY